MVDGGPGGLEINAVEGEFGFQLLDFRSRRRRRRRSLHFHHGGGRSGERWNAVIVYGASDGNAAWVCARRNQRGGATGAGDITGACRVTVDEPAAIRTAGGRSDGGGPARLYARGICGA